MNNIEFLENLIDVIKAQNSFNDIDMALLKGINRIINAKEFRTGYDKNGEAYVYPLDEVKGKEQKYPFGIYKESTNINEAKKFAKSIGVKFANYDNMSLEYANEINKALLTIPVNFRPAIIMDMRSAYKSEFVPKAWQKERSLKAAYGVCIQVGSYNHPFIDKINSKGDLYYRQGIAYNTTSYKSFKKLTDHKQESNKLYKEKYGERYNFNLDGRGTIYHEMAHCYANNYEIPKGFEDLAKKWYQESKIGQLKKVSEAWAEAFAGYYIDNPELPDYIKKYMKGVKL